MHAAAESDVARGAKGPIWGRFTWLRVWPAGGWATGECDDAEPIWQPIEEQADGTLKYAFSNLPADARRINAVGGVSTTTPVW